MYYGCQATVYLYHYYSMMNEDAMQCNDQSIILKYISYKVSVEQYIEEREIHRSPNS